MSVSLRERSPWYLPRNCGMRQCDSSMKSRQSFGKVVEQGAGRAARRRAGEVTAVVLDARAVARPRPSSRGRSWCAPQARGLEQLALFSKIGQPLLELGLDGPDGDPHLLVAGDEVRGREDDDFV